MKNILTIACTISAMSIASFAQSQLSTNVTLGGVHLLSATRVSVYSVELTSDKSVLVKFFDQNSLADPLYGTNYLTSAYTGVNSYATNYVTSFIGNNGLTNWFTNAGIFTYTATIAAATNNLPSSGSFVVGAGTYAIYNTDALFTRGVCFVSTTNVSVVVNYRSGK